MEIFTVIDDKRDGTIDEMEFDNLFRGMKEGWNSHGHDIMHSVLRDA